MALYMAVYANNELVKLVEMKTGSGEKISVHKNGKLIYAIIAADTINNAEEKAFRISHEFKEESFHKY